MYESLYITEYLGMNHIWSCSLVSEYPCSNHWKCSWFPSTSLTLNLEAQSSSSTGFIGAATLGAFVFERTPYYIDPFAGWFIYCRLAWFLKLKQMCINIYIYNIYCFTEMIKRIPNQKYQGIHKISLNLLPTSLRRWSGIGRGTTLGVGAVVWRVGVWGLTGFSPQIIHFNRVFHDFHHPFWGSSIFGNTHLCYVDRFVKHEFVRLCLHTE